MRDATVILCLCVLAGCARSAVDPGLEVLDGSSGTGEPVTVAEGGAANPGADSGSPMSTADAGNPSGNEDSGQTEPDSGTSSGSCEANTLSCESAMLLGNVDASDSGSTVTQQGKGSGWFAIDVTDGNKNSTGTIRIGVSVKLTAPAGSTYAVTIVGDTGPDNGGRCIAADVTDTDPLDKTAIWGSFGPNTAQKRSLALHVEHLSGPCDQNWTLTVTGDPCPVLSIGSGEDSMGSCP